MKKCIFPIICILFINNISSAGAWLMKPGASELIATHEYKILTNFYQDQGQKYLANIYHFSVYDLFYQYGLNDKWTIGMQTQWFDYKFNENTYQEEETLNYNIFAANQSALNKDYKLNENKPYSSKFFAQTCLWQYQDTLLSIQPNVRFFTSKYHKSAGVIWSLGHSFQMGIKTGFINIEAGADLSHGASQTLDATIGYWLNSRNMLMIQSFNHLNTKFYHPEFFNNEEYHNDLRISYIHKYSKSTTTQVGYSTNTTQRKNYISHSIITGIAIKF